MECGTIELLPVQTKELEINIVKENMDLIYKRKRAIFDQPSRDLDFTNR